MGREKRYACAARITTRSTTSTLRARRMLASVLSGAVTVVVVLFWISAAALVWTHAAYPALARLAAAVAPRQVRKSDIEPTVTVIVAAYNEEASIERRIENLLELDYPREKLEIVVSSDALTDRTEE